MTNQDAVSLIKTAHVYGITTGARVDLADLVAAVDCTKPDVLTKDGYLQGESLARALNAIVKARFSRGLHDTQLCEHYDVTYVGINGEPLRRDRWTAIDPEGYPAKTVDTRYLARVSPTQVYRQTTQLGGTGHVIRV